MEGGESGLALAERGIGEDGFVAEDLENSHRQRPVRVGRTGDASLTARSHSHLR